MNTVARRIWCALWGHPDTVVRWGPWLDNAELGRHRVLTEECIRCRGVLRVASILEGRRSWTA